MKVILTTPMSGPAGAFNIGDEYPCESDKEAKSLIAAGFAVAVTNKTERATKKNAKKETR